MSVKNEEFTHILVSLNKSSKIQNSALPALVKRPTIRVIEVKCRMINGRSGAASIFHSDQNRHKLLWMSTKAGKAVSYDKKIYSKDHHAVLSIQMNNRQPVFVAVDFNKAFFTQRGGLGASAQSIHWLPKSFPTMAFLSLIYGKWISFLCLVLCAKSTHLVNLLLHLHFLSC